MPSVYSFSIANCAAKLLADPPLVIKPGDNVLVNLAYSLDNIVTINPSFIPIQQLCTTENNGNTYCLSIPQFLPTAMVVSSSSSLSS
jgi:hypothetical protein